MAHSMKLMERVARCVALSSTLALASVLPCSAGARPPSPSPTPAEAPTRTIAILINGQPIESDVAPRIVDGRLLVPLRLVLDALGVPVTRVGGTITGQLPTGKILLGVGNSAATVNGRLVRLDSPAIDIGGTTFVPLRFIGDALGATTSYDGRGARVEIVSPLIGRNVGDEQAPNGGSRVRGVVSEVDRNSEPPSVTVNIRGSARTISVNSDARIYIEDVTINSQLKGLLSDVRVGDALLAVLARDGKVRELHDFFRSTSGTIAAVSPAAMVLSGGAVITPAAATEITLNGAVAQLPELHVDDYVTVRRNPETGELRQIIVTRKASGTPSPASSVAISSFTISATRTLRAGEFFDVAMQGTAGGHATFDIGSYVTGITMREDAPGAYRARYTIPERFNLTQVPVYGHLAIGGTDAPRTEAPTQLSAATTPPSIIDVAPPSGQIVNTSRPNVYATFTSPSEAGINASSIQLVVNGRDVTASSTRSASFVTYAPGIDYSDGPVTVTVRVADAAGNSSSRSWSFTIKTR
jgi:hypothetical protein